MVISIDSCSSNSWGNYWMSFLELALLLDKTKPGINSILPIVSFWPVSQHLPPWIPYPLSALSPPQDTPQMDTYLPPERTWDQRYPTPRRNMGSEIPYTPPPTNRTQDFKSSSSDEWWRLPCKPEGWSVDSSCAGSVAVTGYPGLVKPIGCSLFT